MQSIYEFLQRLGMQSLDAFWFPMLVWTIVALVIFASFRVFNRLNPIYHYHLRAATLAAIPFGLLATFLIQTVGESLFTSNSFDPAFLVVNTPETFYVAEYTAAEFNPNWMEANFLTGLATSLILAVSVVMLIRLFFSYISLRNLHQSLSKESLTTISEFNQPDLDHIEVSYHEHPLVPFTFGWSNPIIVLPTSIQDDPEKTRMAVQHELVHIKRGDYLLQLFLSVIENLFWFHPLIRAGAREIETWREISCDQEVLNTSGISLKKYASMLYELLPLNRGIGSFSVSMAVQKSTLKKRIMTMKYHKMHQTSIKRSLFFLFIMIAAVTIPIACSDMRGPQGLSDEEVINTSIEFVEPTLTVNGVEVATLPSHNKEFPLSYGISIGTPEYGTITFSGTQFEGATKNAEIEGNTISYTTNNITFKLTNKAEFIEGSSQLWALHQPNRRSGGIRITSSTAANMRDGSYLKSISPELREDLFTSGDEDFFVVVEEMPQLIGGLKAVQSKVEYPPMARRAGIEGRVTVQFIVNENGDVENPKIIRGIGGGCDEAALAAVAQAKFEPGIQRGRPVRVQYSLPVVFKLTDSDFSSIDPAEANAQVSAKKMDFELLQNDNNTLTVKITDKETGNPLVGANIVNSLNNIGAATDPNGIATFSNLEEGNYSLIISYIGYGSGSLEVHVKD